MVLKQKPDFKKSQALNLSKQYYFCLKAFTPGK